MRRGRVARGRGGCGANRATSAGPFTLAGQVASRIVMSPPEVVAVMTLRDEVLTGTVTLVFPPSVWAVTS